MWMQENKRVTLMISPFWKRIGSMLKYLQMEQTSECFLLWLKTKHTWQTCLHQLVFVNTERNCPSCEHMHFRLDSLNFHLGQLLDQMDIELLYYNSGKLGNIAYNKPSWCCYGLLRAQQVLFCSLLINPQNSLVLSWDHQVSYWTLQVQSCKSNVLAYTIFITIFAFFVS